MTSQNKKAKTDKRKHPGIDRHFLKITNKLKRVCFFNASLRKKLKHIESDPIKRSLINNK